jgi:SAM-dependent methyltransferase
VVRPLVKASQLALTGGYARRLNGQLAADLLRGPHDFVLELGCGDAPWLRYVDPGRYVGLDVNGGWLEAARRRHRRSAVEFIEADITTASLEPWRGADAVVCSRLFHHLGEAQIADLVARCFEQAQAQRIVCVDGVMTGPFRDALVWLDEGEPSRPKAELYGLLGRHAEVEETWSFDVPFRTVNIFGFELRPKRQPRARP